MKSTRRSLQSAAAFSIVEMIAVIAVIAILVGLLVPALSMVQKMAAKVSQKGQFANISFGLETYRDEIGDYPESFSNTITGYHGAQRLAEAMIGLDGFGYHPLSLWDGDLTLYDHTDPVNIAARKGPYLELDTSNAVKLNSIYSTPPGTVNGDTFILADKFKNVKNTVTGKKIGMPILYFKANTINVEHPVSILVSDVGDPLRYVTCIYTYLDNRSLLMLPSPIDGDGNPMGVTMGGPMIFYGDTWDENFTAPRQPHNNESFILLSAGADGLYGTRDDVYNFETD
ncbi:MAG: type II secretion system protein [Planctomycetes bacterium]|nr:type II secretion system protein [Planctomycetota bacterium]